MPSSYKSRLAELSSSVEAKNERIGHLTASNLMYQECVRTIYATMFLCMKRYSSLTSLAGPEDYDIAQFIEPSSINISNGGLMADTIIRSLIQVMRTLNEANKDLSQIGTGLDLLDTEVDRTVSLPHLEIPSPLNRALSLAERALKDMEETFDQIPSVEGEELIRESVDLLNDLKLGASKGDDQSLSDATEPEVHNPAPHKGGKNTKKSSSDKSTKRTQARK